jgi:cell fate regulator YaaT (PSP1 superfamily)
VYNIELSFLDHTSAIEGPLQENQIKYNKKFKELICKKLHDCSSDDICEQCSNELDEKLEADITDDSIFEIECKGMIGNLFCTFKPDNKITLNKSELVLISDGECTEIAKVSDIGELVQLKFRLCKNEETELPTFLRKPDENDIQKYNKNLDDEKNAIPFFKKAVEKYKLDMKLVDIHYQFDRKKLFFYYTSDGRVDFRELAKELASQFKTRIELRQIGVRDEAKRMGGLGTCGREFCCASFLNNFKRITTQIANDQNLSSNMSKLSGPCGKLKCCLSYEVE